MAKTNENLAIQLSVDELVAIHTAAEKLWSARSRDELTCDPHSIFVWPQEDGRNDTMYVDILGWYEGVPQDDYVWHYTFNLADSSTDTGWDPHLVLIGQEATTEEKYFTEVGINE